MIQHFSYTSLYENNSLPGWRLTFFAHGQRITGIYHKNGSIEWTSSLNVSTEQEELLKKQLHELMLYHVYDE